MHREYLTFLTRLTPNKDYSVSKKVNYSDCIECGIPFIDRSSHGIAFEAIDNKFVDFHLKRATVVYTRSEFPQLFVDAI